MSAAALVSPFDSLVWQRARASELLGLDYTIEIYVPQPKRVYGYYVLPFLLGERFAARLDLKADRAARSLLVQSSFAEPGEDLDEVVPALMHELREMARWLDLDDVVVRPRGDLAPHLAASLKPWPPRTSSTSARTRRSACSRRTGRQARRWKVSGCGRWTSTAPRATGSRGTARRATFWPSPDQPLTPEADALLAGAQRVHAIDWRWMDTLLDCDLFVYRFDASTFRSTEDVFGPDSQGFWVSDQTITPLDVRRVGPLLHRHAAANIELRATRDLPALWQRVISTPGLAFSGIRLRNL